MFIDRQRLLLYTAENAVLSSSGVRSCCRCLSDLITCLFARALIKHQWGRACKRRRLLLKISISRSPVTASTDVKTLRCCPRRFPLVAGARVQPEGHKRIWEIYKVCGLITHQPTFCASISLFPPPLPVPSLCLAVSPLLTSLVSLWPLTRLSPNYTYLTGIMARGTVVFPLDSLSLLTLAEWSVVRQWIPRILFWLHKSDCLLPEKKKKTENALLLQMS